MSYKQAQELFKKRHGKTAKTSWIADIKNENEKQVVHLPTEKVITSIHVQNQIALT